MPPPAEARELSGCGVLVTRPAGFNEGLKASLGELGAGVFEFPLLSIEPCPVRSDALRVADPPDGLIFTSRNAVEFAFRQWPQLADSFMVTRFCAVGAGTARALRAHGIGQVLIPEGDYSSEGLLALAEFQRPVRQRLVVVTGRGGRTALMGALNARGARVQCLEVYRRAPARAGLKTYLRRHGRAILMIVITSTEALPVLMDGAGRGGRYESVRYPLVVASARIAAAAEHCGFTAPIEIAHQVSDEALVHGCRRLWRLIRQ